MKRILLTGGSGFIGRNLTEALNGEYEIYAPSHKELELLDETAVCDYIRQNRIDDVIHAAVHVPMVNGGEHELANDLRMFLNLTKNSGIVEKTLYFGSGAEYDKRFHIRMAKEEEIGDHIPETDYGLAKYTMNEIARNSDNIYNLRLFGIFGKYELFYIKFLSNLCCKAIYDLPLTVRRDCYFDFLYIEDLAGIVRWFLENTPRHHDYNVCSGKEYLLTELAGKVLRRSGKKLPVKLLSEERNLDYSASNERLRAEIPDLRITEIDPAIGELYGYYEGIRDSVDREILAQSI
ncbi:MAG: NAD(P)-dependent oxidoreductase [Lachnospiraceae bacterium]|nr:NAD(P)-dependent oxidoreductase [Lachnospiraceae bacterium]